MAKIDERAAQQRLQVDSGCVAREAGARCQKWRDNGTVVLLSRRCR